MGSAVLKKYEDEDRHQADLDYVHYAMQYCLHHAAKSLNQAYRNYPVTGVGAILKGLLFPLGNHFATTSDELGVKPAESLNNPRTPR